MGGLFENSVLPASNEDVQFWGTPALDKPLKETHYFPTNKTGISHERTTQNWALGWNNIQFLKNNDDVSWVSLYP